MRTNEDIEGYLIEMGMPFEMLDEGLWSLNDEEDGVENLVIMHSPPIVVFRVKLMEIPEGDHEDLYEQLLKLNGTEMVAGAYGIEEGHVVIVDTLQSENLDFNEFQASIESITMAVAEHYPILSGFRKKVTEKKEEAADQ